MLFFLGPQWQEWQEETGGSSCSAGGEGQALCLRQWVIFLYNMCHACQQERPLLFLFFERQQHKSAMHGVIWQSSCGTQGWQHTNWNLWTSECFFTPFFFNYSWDVAPSVLWDFSAARRSLCKCSPPLYGFAASASLKILTRWQCAKVTEPDVCGSSMGLFFPPDGSQDSATITVTLLCDPVCVCQSAGSATRIVPAWATTIHTLTWPRRRARTARRSRHHPLLASLRSRRVSHSLVLTERDRERDGEEVWLHAI